MKILSIMTSIVLLLSCAPKNNMDSLSKQINDIISTKKATIGVGIYDFEKKESLFINKDKTFVMMSVVKFPQAIALLKQVDEGKLDADMTIHFDEADLRPNTYSPIMNDKTGDTIDISLSEALSYTVSKSDNNVCDKLFKILGSPKVAEDYVQSLGLTSTTIGTDYANMAANTMYANQSSPMDMLELLRMFYHNELLSKKSHDLLWQKLVETSTGFDRIRGLLPEGTNVGHKTGSSGTDESGVTAAFNDVGIVKLPDGNSFAIAVFIADSKETGDTNAKIIAEISKAAYDCFIE